MKKKILTGLLLGALVTCVLTGCGGKKSITNMSDAEIDEYLSEMTIDEYSEFMDELSSEEYERYDKYLNATWEPSYSEPDFEDMDEDNDSEDAFVEEEAVPEVIEPLDEIMNASWTDFKLQLDHTIVSFRYPMTVEEFLSQLDSEEYEWEETSGLCDSGSYTTIHVRNRAIASTSDTYSEASALDVLVENMTEDMMRVSDCIVSEVSTEWCYTGSVYFPGGLKGTASLLEGDETYAYGTLEEYVESLVDRVSDKNSETLYNDPSLVGSSVTNAYKDSTMGNFRVITAWSEDSVDTEEYTSDYVKDGYMKAELRYRLNMDSATYSMPQFKWNLEYVPRAK